MTNDSNKNASFTANLFLQGLPVVLNQQRLKLRLRNPRLTRHERLDNEIALASVSGSNFLTLADNEDDKPLLLRFIPKDGKYAVKTILKGEYDEHFLGLAPDTKRVIASAERGAQVSLSNSKNVAVGFADLQRGPAHVYVGVAGHLLFQGLEDGERFFKDSDPNNTGHNAFNNEPARFVLKVIAHSENG